MKNTFILQRKKKVKHTYLSKTLSSLAQSSAFSTEIDN